MIRRAFFKFSLNTSFLFVMFSFLKNLIKLERERERERERDPFNPHPTKPQDVFKLLKEAKLNPELIKEAHGHDCSAPGASSTCSHVKTAPCTSAGWPSGNPDPDPPSSSNPGTLEPGSSPSYRMTWNQKVTANYNSGILKSQGGACPNGHTSCKITRQVFKYRQLDYSDMPSGQSNRLEAKDSLCRPVPSGSP